MRQTQFPVVRGHEMGHSLAQPQALRWGALGIGWQFYVSHLPVEFQDDGILWSPRCQSALNDGRHTLRPEARLPSWN